MTSPDASGRSLERPRFGPEPLAARGSDGFPSVAGDPLDLAPTHGVAENQSDRAFRDGTAFAPEEYDDPGLAPMG